MKTDDFVRLKALRDISRKLDSQSRMLIELNKQSKSRGWLFDFSSNIAGNAVWDGIIYLFKFIRK